MSGHVLSDYDTHLWAEGSHFRAFEKLGAHVTQINGVSGTSFVTWAPNARSVAVIGDFNHWNRDANNMTALGSSGLWECFIPNIGQGAVYKFAITSQFNNFSVDKTDPYGYAAEVRPRTASVVWDISRYNWGDAEWMETRHRTSNLHAPISVYEVHLGSWRRGGDDQRWLTYRELAPLLADYVQSMGYTHVELMPISEHPFDGSWGYQTVGYYAPTSRFGTPDDFMFLVDHLHQQGIGVILDWVPAHFPKDEHGLAYFDGTHLYEHADPQQGEHQEWGTYIFNFGRREVVNFLVSNAVFWLQKYHIDGLRVDAVASMLYLDYSRKAGEWTPNRFGGRENLEAVDFLRRLNERVYAEFPDAMMIAEESTAWPQVSRPTYVGGLGFGYKWDMGWMHDTLGYLSHDPIHRKFHHNMLTFRGIYAFTESYMLPLSHDEVVHGKGSLYTKMPGDHWQKFANLRLLFGSMFMQPGKKLMFMGCEFGQMKEWNHDTSLDWHLLGSEPHAQLQRWIRDLNTFYRAEPSLHASDCAAEGFTWVDANDWEGSVVSYLRQPLPEQKPSADNLLLVVCNFTPLPRHNYHLGVSMGGRWKEVLNSDAPLYGGSGQGNMGGVEASPVACHGREYLLNITLPPLGIVVFKPDR